MLIEKRVIIMLLSMITLSFSACSQSSEKEVQNEFFKSDMLLSIVLNYIPKNWSISAENDRFTLQRGDSIWILDGNTINALAESREDQDKRIQAFGRKDVARIVMRYETRWTVDKTEQANIKNATILDQINKLPDKLGISHLNKSGGKGTQLFVPDNEREKQKIEEYEKEKARLEAKFVPVPDFNTEKYSLFIIDRQGCADNFHLVYPYDATKEYYMVLNTFREVCGK